MNNLEIRLAIKKARLYNYEVAAELGVSESHFSRKLRNEMGEEERQRVLDAIERVVERRT